MRRFWVIAAVAALVALLCPGLALASQEGQNGWAYISVSNDGAFAISDGEVADAVMWRVPVDLAEVSAVDLADYGLANFKYDEDGDGVYETTLLQLMIYVSEHYCNAGASKMEFSGGPHGIFINGFFGYDINLNYYVNGAFPLDPTLGPAKGATADVITLSDGDFVDVAHYTSYDFYSDELAGFHYFMQGDNIVHSYVAQPGTPLEVKVGRTHSDMDTAATTLEPEARYLVFESDELGNAGPPEVGTTAEGGTLSVTFGEPGVYYLSVFGAQGATTKLPGTDTPAIVSSPAAAKVYVTPAATETQQLVNAIAQARRALGDTASSPNGFDVAPSDYWAEPEAIGTLKGAISAAAAVLEAPPADAAEAGQAIDALADAKVGFMNSRRHGATPSDMLVGQLRDVINDAAAAVISTKASTDGSDVLPTQKWATKADRDAFMAQVAAANALFGSDGELGEDVSVCRVEAAISSLVEATDSFEALAKPGKTPNTAALSAAITAAKKAESGVKVSSKGGADVDPSDKWTTAAAKKKLDTAIAAAEAVAEQAASGKATFKAVAAQTEAVNAARTAFAKTVKPGTKPAAKTVTRLGGQGRYGTMALIASAGFEAHSCSTILLATGTNYADALTASALSGALGAPIVTTKGTALSADSKAEIAKLSNGHAKVYVLGGTAAVSDACARDAAKAAGSTYSPSNRIAGNGRIETALAIYNAGKGAWGDTAIVVDGWNYPDALSVGPWAAYAKAPIFGAKKGTLNTAQLAALKAGGFKKIVVVGGDSAVNFAAVKKQTAGAGLSVQWCRFAGAGRYETSALFAKWATGRLAAGSNAAGATVGFAPSVRLSLDGMGAATGKSYADALAAVDLLGQTGAPLLLVADNKATQGNIASLVKANAASIQNAYVFGGEAAVSKSVEAQLKSALGAK